ncbi:MAG TPA: ROK family transcriptional regulator [Limnochordia bacterium]|nr:ROK family transcriptional regulator [Limnochordia bacterium]
MDKTRRVDASGKASSTPPGARMSQLVKNLNRSVVLELLRREGPLSRTEIARRAGISLPVVSRLIQTLLAENRVVEVGKTGSSGGRRRTLIGYNESYGKVAGVDMGATKTVIGVTDLSGRTLWERRVPTAQLSASGNLIDALAAAIERAVHEAGVGLRELVGVGVGVPGIVRNGVIFEAPGLKLSDAEREIEKGLGERLDLPVWVDNDVNAIVLGEHWKGQLQGVDDALCVAIGTGIGVGILAGGQLYRGAHGAAGEMGYWIFESAPQLQSDADQYGYLETIAAGPGIERRALAAARAQPESLLAKKIAAQPTPGTLAATDVFAAAAQGDPAALEVVRETTDVLGVALGNAAALLDPEVIVITGGVARAGELLRAPIAETVARVAPYPPRVVLSTLYEQAAILGSVWGVLHKHESSLRINVE